MTERRRFGRRLRVLCERSILSAGMSVIAVVIERRLVRALKGGLKPAPRTAEGTDQRRRGVGLDIPVAPTASVTAPQQVGDQGER